MTPRSEARVADTLRTVVVGCGGISRSWFGSRAMQEDVEVVGLVDLDVAAAQALAAREELGDVVIGSDLAEVLAQCRPEAVFDLTVPAAHPTVTTTALEHGCHVLGEKPMAENLEDALAMVEAAKQAGRIYAVTQTRRWNPAIRRLRRFLDSGAIGRVHTLHADFFIAAHFGGFREQMAHVLLVDMAIHSFDQARMISGADPRNAICHEWNHPGSWYQHDASAVAIFEMSDEIVFSYRGNWAATGAQTEWNCSWRIFGTHGSACWDGRDAISAERLVDPAQPSSSAGGPLIRSIEAQDVPEYDEIDQRQNHDGAIAAFAKAISEGGEPETVCHDNIKSLAMVLAAVDSSERGERVSIQLG